MTGLAASTLDALRRGGQAARSALATIAFHAGGADQEVRSQVRADVTASLAESLCATDASVARRLLREEIAAHEAAGVGASETLFTLVAIVARFGSPPDVFLVWRARQATPETRLGVDVEQVGRLGLERVRAILEQAASGAGPHADAARHALAWIAQGVESGAFADLAGYFLWSDERFGVAVSGST